eukprot:jgi/Mesvir1/27416/Mv07213-RA.1
MGIPTSYNVSTCSRMLIVHNAVASWLLQPSVESITLLASHPCVCETLLEWSWAANLAPSTRTSSPSSKGFDRYSDDLDGGVADAGTDPYGDYSSRGGASTPPGNRKASGVSRPAQNPECAPPSDTSGPTACTRVPTGDSGWASHPVCHVPAGTRGGSSRAWAADGPSPGSGGRLHQGPARLKCIPLTDPSCFRPSVVPGVPTVQCVFNRGITEARPSSPVLMMVNSDIVLPEDIGPFVTSASGLFPRFFAVGQRMDIVGGLPRHLASYQRFRQHARGAGFDGAWGQASKSETAVGGAYEEGWDVAGSAEFTVPDYSAAGMGGLESADQASKDELSPQGAAIEEHWRAGLLDLVSAPETFLHGVHGMDYFIFNRPAFCMDDDESRRGGG